MAELISCEDCEHKISPKASSCPNCGCPTPNREATSDNQKLSAASGPGEKPTKEAEKKDAENKAGSIGCSIIIILAFAWAYFGTSGESSSKNWQDKDNSVGAYVMMQTFVKRRLKSPASADFASYNDSRVIRISGQLYSVSSYVDSQNGFGATIRTPFSGSIEKTSADEWQLKKLDL